MRDAPRGRGFTLLNSPRGTCKKESGKRANFRIGYLVRGQAEIPGDRPDIGEKVRRYTGLSAFPER